jgi:hypothetical protein
MKPTNTTVLIDPTTKVTLEKKSNAKIINFPVDFADGSVGALILCKVTEDKWQPWKDISGITIHYTINEKK